MSDEQPIGRELRFGSRTIVADCYCVVCGWEITPTGWYDDDGPVTKDDLASAWQAFHNYDGECREQIEWRELA